MKTFSSWLCQQLNLVLEPLYISEVAERVMVCKAPRPIIKVQLLTYTEPKLLFLRPRCVLYFHYPQERAYDQILGQA